MFYHIRIKYFDQNTKENQKLRSFDITDLSIVEEYIKSYLQGNPIFISGSRLMPEEIKSFQVFNSDDNIDECRKICNSRIPSGVMMAYTNDTILSMEQICHDITDTLFERVKSEMANN